MEKIEGFIEVAEVKEGVKQNGEAWKRMAYTIQSHKYSTFDANKQNCKAGDFITLTYKKSPDGKFNTIETIEKSEDRQPEIKTEKVSMEENQPPHYVNKDKVIVRQNSLTQANSFASNILKQIELGIIPKEDAKINLLKILEWAKEFENHVFRE